ncbi:hypothetical protein F5148DRAFT_1198413 [Russula earlei]|uniref:Uncharacterized protein n=1 Tax=Russula earlei TaxID=71964 RepID=A0ACC0U996_9AGAM|nr:hypothetical protein F5148DRAFT_1198413 [Russula earlei]
MSARGMVSVSLLPIFPILMLGRRTSGFHIYDDGALTRGQRLSFPRSSPSNRMDLVLSLQARVARGPGAQTWVFSLCTRFAGSGDVAMQTRHVAIFDTHGPVYAIRLSLCSGHSRRNGIFPGG